jgi:hypothetical protein
MNALKRFDTEPAKEHWPEHWQAIAKVCNDVAAEVGQDDALDAAYCYFAQEIDFPFTEHMRQEFERAIEVIK